ncbi:helix-turn-helix domain-containing protein [Dechloromonas sp. A34]|uniref:helix-turn-helix domain-containing protein n=1 Tax=Dechloromonas sp. A34 TaxID=447588 RepID=UPI002248FC1C|nr:helix-turn-helix transcriptional regulator [Dechloromonas sp. A34]
MTRIEALGVVIRDARTRRSISQEKLAAFAKLHRNALGRIERSEVALNLNTLWLIADAMGVTASELVQEAEILAATDEQASSA